MTTSELYLVVDDGAAPERRDEAAAIERSLVAAGVTARVAAPAAIPPGAPRLVFAGDLDRLVAGMGDDAREAWLDATIAIDADEDRAALLVEERGLLGAVVCGAPADWVAGNGSALHVRRDVVRRRGEPLFDLDASESYAGWDDPSAGSLAEALAGYLAHWREIDAERVVPSSEALARKLAPVELRVRLGATGLFRVPAGQAPGYYLVLSSEPGGGAGFAARPVVDDGGPADLEQVARRMLQNPRGPELIASSAPETVRLSGTEREAICLHADWLRFRTATCAVRIEHAHGAMLALFICSIGAAQPTSAMVLGDPSLRRIARTLRVVDAEAGSSD
jgi:hypothetical protein